MWDKIKNFVFGGGLLLAWAITLGFLDWRAEHHAREYLKTDDGIRLINEMIDGALSSQDLATDSKIVDMDSNIQANAATGAENKEDIEFVQQQLIDIANILMRPPGE